ncbi:MAG: toxin-antitoxin system HicB family antitoxin [Candidatus Sabulitectum sp.]|nr:toxin-antitoxin system HicB family antitoxin [Candidatus Sabulitectum sp.]
MKKHTLEYYLSLNYKVELYPDEGAFVAEIPDLPGCITQGDTMEETVALINEAKHLWLETAIDRGISIQEPKNLDEYSGKFLLRMPKSLHARLAGQATYEGISLNQYVVFLLSGKAAENRVEKPFPDSEKVETISLGKCSFPGFEYKIIVNENEATG